MPDRNIFSLGGDYLARTRHMLCCSMSVLSFHLCSCNIFPEWPRLVHIASRQPKDPSFTSKWRDCSGERSFLQSSLPALHRKSWGQTTEMAECLLLAPSGDTSDWWCRYRRRPEPQGIGHSWLAGTKEQIWPYSGMIQPFAISQVSSPHEWVNFVLFISWFRIKL